MPHIVCDVSAPYMPVSVHIWLSNLTYEGALPYMRNICAHIRFSIDKYMSYDSNIYDNIICLYDPYITFPYGLSLDLWLSVCSGRIRNSCIEMFDPKISTAWSLIRFCSSD